LKILETERLKLRRITTYDSPFIIELLNDPSFIKNIGDKKVRSEEDAHKYILNGPVLSYEKHGFGLYLVELKNSGTPIGICGLIKRDNLDDVDVGFAFLSDYRCKGYAFESASAVVEYGRKNFGLKRVLGITTPENIPSINVLQKIGLTFETMIKMTDDEPEIKLFAVNFD